MSDHDIDPAEVPQGWELTGGEGACLRRRFELADFAEAWRFMSGVAAEAERRQHHPDWSNSWNVVTVELRSHDAGAVTGRDLELARAIDAVLDAL
jgi:4a-hydroxytetrahydrobiopterin dehydratase